MKCSFSIRRLAQVTLLGLATALSAETVSRISVVDLNGNANRQTLEGMVAATIETGVGKELNLAQLSKDIEELGKKPGVDYVKTRTDKLEDGTCQVTFMVALKNRISAVRFEGATAYSEGSLRRLTRSRAGDLADDTRIAADRKAIMDRYDKAGYHGTEVHSRIATEDGQPVLIFVVQEKNRCKLKGVEFEGNSAIDSSELADTIYTRRAWWRYILRFGNYYNARLHALDIQKILTLYASRGYLDCQVVSVEPRYEDDSKSWVTPVFKIVEGPQYTFAGRSFEGNSVIPTNDLEARCTLEAGKPYNATQAEADLNAMKALYDAKGYLDLQFRPVLTRNAQEKSVSVAYRIVEKSPLHIGNINISGNTFTSERVIRRELQIFEDDLADATKIALSKRRLMNLGYFSSVEIIPKVTTNPALRDLSIEVEEKPTGSISLGAAFSTEDSVMGFLELQETNFSLSRLLAFEKPKGDGQRMRAYLGIGSETQNVSISLTEPALFDSQFRWTNEVFLNTRYEDEYDERHLGFGSMLSWPVAFTLPFTDHVEYWDMGIGLRVEQIRISDIDDEEKFDPNDGTDPSDWPFPEGMNYTLEDDKGSEFANRLVFNMTRDTRNHFIFPNRGSRITLEAEYITRALGSYADYFKFHLGGEAYLPVYDTLFLRLALNGHTVSHISGDDVAVFDRYFAGGYGTLRGFKRHDVSPVNRNENSIGGKTMLVSTVEFIQPVRDFVFLKLFTDIGNVWWDSWGADLGELNASIGIGVQFRKLPVRLDYGFPVLTEGEHLDGSNGRFHFSIDYSF